MTNIIEYLERGIAITTPIFFFIVLVAILRVLRLLDLSMKTLVFLQRRFEKLEQTIKRSMEPTAPGVQTQMEKEWKKEDKEQ